MYKLFLKRVFDLIVSTCLLVVLLPLLLIIAILLLVITWESPLFFQLRSGKNGTPFRLIKFKSMSGKKDVLGNLLPDEARTTRIGLFLRKTSIDEIPQLVNVLKGEMSLVGPRPLLIEYLSLYNNIQARRHQVLPGITGWAQVNGRNAIGWKEKFAYDVWYVDNMSFLVDIRILLRTIKKIVQREGINAEGGVTMEKFLGN